jgi:hypothetical protein
MSKQPGDAGRAIPSPHMRYSLLRDICNSALNGDFATELRLPGILTQIACSFLPVIDALCAARDYVAASLTRRSRSICSKGSLGFGCSREYQARHAGRPH